MDYYQGIPIYEGTDIRDLAVLMAGRFEAEFEGGDDQDVGDIFVEDLDFGYSLIRGMNSDRSNGKVFRRELLREGISVGIVSVVNENISKSNTEPRNVVRLRCQRDNFRLRR